MTNDSSFTQLSNVSRYLLSHFGGMLPEEKLLLIVDETTVELVQYFHHAADELELLQATL
ncbi:hypothetical protein [Synechococcus sp. UW105]|uniref:hypothetical protein n=1 Tax=Synechococcus sp. UW105 TaxID=337067 RepID=UPI0010BDF140|nr:hypothetical protein [Synechococcus sp. UW105]